METGGASDYPPLEGKPRVDVAVVGAGIAGIATGLLLKEARPSPSWRPTLGSGVTGHTTAKVTSLHGLVYDDVRSKFGDDGARAYAQANQAGLEWIADRAAEIPCEFRRNSAYTYATEPKTRGKLEAEVEAATAAGLPLRLVEETPLPYPVEAAVRLDNQAEFHPRRFLLGLAERIHGDGSFVFERTRAVSVHEGSPCTIQTDRGELVAERVVVASHFPFLDRSLAFARMHPERSYALGLRIEGAPPDGMHISADGPTRSIRSHPLEGREVLIVGGEGHKVGQGGDTRERYERLEAFAREHWDVRSIDYRWSSQDNITADGVPYVGAITPLSKRVLYATGFAKWGLTNGAAAARMLADRLLGIDNPWAETFDANRLKPLAQAKDLVTENANVAVHFFGDRIRAPAVRSLADLEPGEGAIVSDGGRKLAAYRHEDGQVSAVSPICTHLWCQVSWNAAERSWDCPCHGSRFDTDGRVLQGPAVEDLEARAVGPDG